MTAVLVLLLAIDAESSGGLLRRAGRGTLKEHVYPLDHSGTLLSWDGPIYFPPSLHTRHEFNQMDVNSYPLPPTHIYL